MFRRLLPLLRLATMGAMCVAGACASPTLPLPPPLAPTQTETADADHVKLAAPCGGAEPSALIVILNTNPSLAGDMAVSGSLANNCGAWDAIVYAHRGDVLSITQEMGTESSSHTHYQVQ
jgi:hypothetical protein